MKEIILLLLILLNITLLHTQEIQQEEKKFLVESFDLLGEIVNQKLKTTETEIVEDSDADDIKLTFEEIVIKKGYPLSNDYVITSDGYILKLYRISAGKNQPENYKKDPNRKVVLLQHGLVDSSDSWVSNIESMSVPFMLANMGYDVWLGNNRGNKYSRDHMELNADKDSQYWNFSLHEMGTLDLPAMIDHILWETGKEKISYIGHSQGTAQLFAALTLNNDYFAKRLNCFLAFGPVTNLQNLGSWMIKLMAETKLDNVLSTLHLYNEFLPNKQAEENFTNYICKNFIGFCKKVLNIISDATTEDDNWSRFLVFNSHYPSGSSLRSLHHFADSIRNKRFAQLDDNSTPYDLTKIKDIPISLFVGKEDLCATVADNRNLKETLEKSGVLKFYKEYDNMGHTSFFISKTNLHVVDAIKILEEANK